MAVVGAAGQYRPAPLDPCQAVYDRLAEQGWDPKGPVHAFRANCPAHGGDSHQLKVREGDDGRVLMYCHTNRCELNDIRVALGMEWHELFPPGHERARNVDDPDPAPEPKRRVTKLAELLALLDEIKQPWTVMVGTQCAFCGSDGAWIRTVPNRPAVAPYTYTDERGVEWTNPGHDAVRGGGLYIDCPNGCSNRAFDQGLRGKVKRAREGR